MNTRCEFPLTMVLCLISPSSPPPSLCCLFTLYSAIRISASHKATSIYLISKSVCSLIWLMRLFGLNCLIALNHFIVCAWICDLSERTSVTIVFSFFFLSLHFSCMRFSVKNTYIMFLLHLSILVFTQQQKKSNGSDDDVCKQTILKPDIAHIYISHAKTFLFHSLPLLLLLQSHSKPWHSCMRVLTWFPFWKSYL